jgi:hypothetical protein
MTMLTTTLEGRWTLPHSIAQLALCLAVILLVAESPWISGSVAGSLDPIRGVAGPAGNGVLPVAAPDTGDTLTVQPVPRDSSRVADLTRMRPILPDPVLLPDPPATFSIDRRPPADASLPAQDEEDVPPPAEDPGAFASPPLPPPNASRPPIRNHRFHRLADGPPSTGWGLYTYVLTTVPQPCNPSEWSKFDLLVREIMAVHARQGAFPVTGDSTTYNLFVLPVDSSDAPDVAASRQIIEQVRGQFPEWGSVFQRPGPFLLSVSHPPDAEEPSGGALLFDLTTFNAHAVGIALSEYTERLQREALSGTERIEDLSRRLSIASALYTFSDHIRTGVGSITGMLSAQPAEAAPCVR